MEVLSGVFCFLLLATQVLQDITDLLLRELKAFVASTRFTASVSGVVNSWRIACMAASQPDRCPAHTWRGSAVLWMSSLREFAISLSKMRLGVSPMPMGRTPGNLFRATRRH